MNETRQRGTDKGDVVTEELRDGVWCVVAAPVALDPVPDEAPARRRGRPPKGVA